MRITLGLFLALLIHGGILVDSFSFTCTHRRDRQPGSAMFPCSEGNLVNVWTLTSISSKTAAKVSRGRGTATCLSASPSSISQRQQFAAQQEQLRQQLREEEAQRRYNAHLERIANGDDDSCRTLGSIEKWRSYASDRSKMTITEESGSNRGDKSSNIDPPSSSSSTVADAARSKSSSLDARGFALFQPDLFQWEEHGVDFKAIADTMERLTNDGWPPVFIFLFDQPWKMCLRLFDLMCPLLNDSESVLEASIYAWALERPITETTAAGKKKEKVGTNFGVPHRDITFKNCHNPIDGSPDIPSLWIPVVDVSTDNGCMYVVPRECDPQFAVDNVPKDQDPFQHKFPYSAVRPLAPITAGTTLVWHPNLIHWGSSCSAHSDLPPRKSIAMAFRVRESTRPSTEKELERYGRIPFSKAELLEGKPDFKGRLQMIAKSLMLYNVWYPEYDGLDLNKFE